MSEIEVCEPGAGTPGASAAASPVTALAPFNRWVIVVGGLLFAVLMAVSDRYGFHHDELYFLDCGRHLQASYVDQPVFTPLLAWVTLKTFGVSLVGLHLWPALAAWGTVIVAGLTAREFGGGRRPQLLAAFAVATMPAVYGADHLFDTTAFDILAWGALALVVVRIGRTGDLRGWIPAGVILGLGAENKHLVGLFAIGIVIEASVSFVGLGVQPPLPSWGNMLADARNYLLSGEWWLSVFPGACISVAVVAINLLGDGMRDRLDPRHSPSAMTA